MKISLPKGSSAKIQELLNTSWEEFYQEENSRCPQNPKLEYFLLIVNKIYTANKRNTYSKDRWKRLDSESGWGEVYHKDFTTLAGTTTYTYYVNFLVKHGIIEYKKFTSDQQAESNYRHDAKSNLGLAKQDQVNDKAYSPKSGRSMQYRILIPSTEVVEYNLSHPKAIEKYLKLQSKITSQAKEKEELKTYSPIEEFIRKSTANLKMDYAKAQELFTELGSGKAKSQEHLDRVIKAHQGKYTQFSVDNYSQRVHSFMTSIPSVCIPSLSYEGQRLAELDIKNSQWVVMTLAMQGHLRDQVPQDLHTTYNKLVKAASGPGASQFMELALSGGLHEHNAQLWECSRDEAKDKLSKALFSANRVRGNKVEPTKSAQILFEAFPFLEDLWNKMPLERKTYSKKSENDLRSKLPRLLQVLERHILIDGVAVSLVDHVDFLATKHDSIVCLQSDLDIVKRVTQQIFKDEFNLKIIIKTTRHGLTELEQVVAMLDNI